MAVLSNRPAVTLVVACRQRRAFTLIEMIVVIGILTVLMGITVGALFANRRTDKLMATEHLVGGLVRQARHTARTSGAPVLLQINQADRTVAGIMRTPAWGATFDGSPSTATPEETPPLGNLDGYSGKGYLVTTTGLTESVAVAKNRIGRANTIGFYMSCAVRPPLASGGVLPLLTVSRSTSLEDSIGGIALVALTTDLQDYSTLPENPADAGKFPPMVTVTNYELLGWVGDGSATPITVSNLDPATRAPDMPDTTVDSHLTVPSNPTTLQGYDFGNAIVGGSWMEVGLLYDGAQLVLFLNGRRVGTIATTEPIPSSTDETVCIGFYTRAGSPFVADGVVFDNIRVERLSRSQTVSLPTGVEPDGDHRIVCMPDGRVEVDGGAAAVGSTTDLGFHDTTGNRQALLRLTVDGTLTSSLSDVP